MAPGTIEMGLEPEYLMAVLELMSAGVFLEPQPMGSSLELSSTGVGLDPGSAVSGLDSGFTGPWVHMDWPGAYSQPGTGASVEFGSQGLVWSLRSWALTWCLESLELSWSLEPRSLVQLWSLLRLLDLQSNGGWCYGDWPGTVQA